MQAAAQKHMARPGEKNGRARLSDGEIRLIRHIAASGSFTDERIGSSFGITGRHVRRIVCGEMRKMAGGPICNLAIVVIEQILTTPPEVLEADLAAEVEPMPFDTTQIIRCTCGAKCHPSRENPKLCMICARSEKLPKRKVA